MNAAGTASEERVRVPHLENGFFRLSRYYFCAQWEVDKIEHQPLFINGRWCPAGKVTDLRARGGFTVDIEWKDGKVTNYRIRSKEPREVKLRVNGETKTIKSGRL
jgi:hypothetical protein